VTRAVGGQEEVCNIINQFKTVQFLRIQRFFQATPAASKYSDPNAASAYIGNLELFDPAEVGTSKWPPDPGEVGTSKRPLTKARSRHSSGLQNQAGLGLSNGLRMRR
jgi:hypothetical protein